MASINSHRAKDGSLTYRVRIRHRGLPLRTASFPTLEEAQQFAEAMSQQYAHMPSKAGKPSVTLMPRHTLSDVLVKYLRDVMPTKTVETQRGQRHVVHYWNRHLGHMLLQDIQPRHIIPIRDALARTSAPATVVKYLNVLSHAYTVAVKELQWIDQNPCQRVSRPRLPQGRVRYLSTDERERLLAACRESLNPRLLPLFVLALSTGMRRGELLRIQQQDIDLDRGLIHLEITKNKHRRTIPLVGLALTLLRDMPRHPMSPYLFPSSKGGSQWRGYRTAWNEALKRAKVTNYRFHDNRHSAGSYLVQCGIPLYTVSSILGHRSPVQTARYAHHSTDTLRDALEVMTSKIF